MEPRAGAEENARRQNTLRTLSRERVTHALERIRQSGWLNRRFVVIIQGGSRTRESRTYESVRGARSNTRPYRDREFTCLSDSRPIPFGTESCQNRGYGETKTFL